MNDSLYVDFDGLEGNVHELEIWKNEFDELNTRINAKIDELNSVWQGADYDAMKANIESELRKITGPEGMIQSFVKNSISSINEKRSNYVAIQKSNASFWG